MAGHMEFEFNIRGDAAGMRREQIPFNILVLGNFSGHATKPAGDQEEILASSKIFRVDLDSADELFSYISPCLSWQTGPMSIEFSPRDIDDFHPDQLFRMLPVFRDLREMRKKLLDPETAQATLDQILSTRTVIEGEIVDESGHPAEAGSSEDAGEMFERLLGRSSSPRNAPPEQSPELQKLDAFIRELVAPHIVHETDPRVETALDSVDLGIAETMRRILHHPEFQALEGSWRSLFDLVTELELDEHLQLYVCDLQRDEMLTALPDPGAGLQDSALFQLLVDRRHQAADDTPWSVILGDYYFGPDPEDIALLTALGAVATANGGIFIGGARPEILGCNSSAELANVKYWSAAGDDNSLWHSLRTSPIAGHIGLALPRVLARLPYGENTEEIDSFVFEEMPQRNHEDYLWANPAYACGRLLAEQFTRVGWQMEPGDHVDLGYLPAHHFEEDGESRLQPCAELLLSESTMVAMFEQGLMPLISYRNQNTAVLGRFQSIASPAAALAGPWA